jgi:hypothetical protein
MIMTIFSMVKKDISLGLNEFRQDREENSIIITRQLSGNQARRK